MFESNSVDLEILKKRAFNLRWATVPDDVIPLTAADPDFPCAPEITEEIIRFVSNRYFSYGPVEGLSEFRESMSRFLSTRRKVTTDPAHVLAVDSAAFGIFFTCHAFLGKGDEAIIFDPVDFLFRYSVEAAGATALSFAIPPGTDDVDFDRLESAITKNTRMLCLCNPLNPTGKVFTTEELQRFGEIAERHNLIILSDEIWSDIVFSPNRFTSIASLGEEVKKRTIIITGFSKSYGLAGLRIGAVVAFDNNIFSKLLSGNHRHFSLIH